MHLFLRSLTISRRELTFFSKRPFFCFKSLFLRLRFLTEFLITDKFLFLRLGVEKSSSSKSPILLEHKNLFLEDGNGLDGNEVLAVSKDLKYYIYNIKKKK